MESYFLVFYALHFLLLTAENLAVRMDSRTFYRRKRWKVRVLGGVDGESSDYFMDGSDTGHMGVKIGGRQGFSLDFEIRHFCIKFLARKDCLISFEW